MNRIWIIRGTSFLIGVVGDPPPGVAGRNVPPPLLILVPAKPYPFAFLGDLCESHGSIPIGIDASGRGGKLSLCGLVATFERSTGVELFPYKAKW